MLKRIIQVYVGHNPNFASETNQGERAVLEMTEGTHTIYFSVFIVIFFGLNGKNVTCDNISLAIKLK